MIKIYGKGPTRWLKCIWMARELGIHFEEVNVKFTPEAGGFGGEEYRRLNPFNAVPALEDGDFKLFESQAIMNYLGDKYPDKKLIPKAGTYERALYDQWTFFCVSSLEFSLWSWFRHSKLFSEDKKNEQEIDRSAQELETRLAILSKTMGHKEYLVGDTFTGADITMAYTLNWAGAYGFTEHYENLRAYAKHHVSRDAYPKHLT